MISVSTCVVADQVILFILLHTPPHRELAFQIYKEYERFSKYFDNIRTAVFFGGISIKKDEEVLRGSSCPHIVVGTPGRVLALVRDKTLNLKNTKHFILDECDKMLEQLGEPCSVSTSPAFLMELHVYIIVIHAVLRS